MSKYRVKLTNEAEEDLGWFRKNERKSYLKCFDLLRSIIKTPRTGIGKPERLRHFEDKEMYSRRVNQKDRMIYEIDEPEKQVDITSCRGHYDS